MARAWNCPCRAFPLDGPHEFRTAGRNDHRSPHRRRTGEHTGPLDLLRLDEQLVRLQLIGKNITETEGEPGTRRISLLTEAAGDHRGADHRPGRVWRHEHGQFEHERAGCSVRLQGHAVGYQR